MDGLTSPERVRRVFIVDDHPVVRRGLRQLIDDAPDLEVCGEAEGVDDALAQLEAARPDVMSIDLSLKQGHGLELIREVHLRRPAIKLLVSTMQDESLFAERVLRAGATGFVNKVEASERIVDAIRTVLSGAVYLSPRMTDRLLHRMSGGEFLDKAPIHSLTDRELRVFELIGHGLATKEIAARLEVSVKTIEAHREHLKGKLQLHSGTELNREAMHWLLDQR